jgi:hypothetical protein
MPKIRLLIVVSLAVLLGPRLQTAAGAAPEDGTHRNLPKPAVAAVRESGVLTEADRHFWSYLPLAPVSPPAVKDTAWCRSPVDRFILAKLEEKGLAPAAPASKQRLIRRLYFDLIGLPPTPDDLDAAIKDKSPTWYEKLVDRLLANPHYGERWARHWLDVVRYADSDGYEADADRPGMYYYRDFVIRAFIEDIPYETFVKWQIAGDEYQPNNIFAISATGFCTTGPVSVLKPGEGTKAELEQYRYDELDDIVSTTGSAFLGMTIACARCHDHKYDPIPSKDYYRLTAAFTTTKRAGFAFRFDQKYDPAKVQAAYNMPLGLTEGTTEPEKTWLLGRGDPTKKLEPVTLGFLSVLEPDSSPDRWIRKEKPERLKSTYQRMALAEWLIDVKQGAGSLLARVIVNRLWQHHFGTGIVASPNDFGTQGERPSHPELLEFLANELVHNGWHLKPIHRLILTSNAYMQDTTFDPAKARVDPDDRLLWRRRPMRVEAEVLRDTVLMLGGQLNLKLYGPAVKPALPSEAAAGRNKDALPRPKVDTPDQWRRSVYLFVKRSLTNPLMDVFDAAGPVASVGKRNESTVATQALSLMNSPFIYRQAALFADRCMVGSTRDPAAMVKRAYLLAFSREPSPQELEAAVKFLGKDIKRDNVINFCHTLMTLNEFVYID